MRRPHALAAACLLLGPVPAQVADWHRLPALTSTATKGLAYDYARARMVLFESSGWLDVSRTWERVGDAWSLRRPATTPPPRHDFAFGYDVLRERFVLFGGTTNYYWSSPGATLGDTWEYDGIEWVQRFPTTAPPAQVAAWLGFDFANFALLLCGGTASAGVPGAWHWDGTTWTARPAAPFAAHQTAVASDPARLRIVAVGTFFLNGSFARTTHEWNGVAWQQPLPPSQILPLYGNLAFVAQRGTVVLHGRSAASSASGAELWEWNGTTWSQIGAGAPFASDRCWAHDPVRNRTFGFSSQMTSSAATDTVQWDGTNWTSEFTSVGPDLLGCTTYDAGRQRTIALLRTATLGWDGARWSSEPAPPGLQSPIGIAFDAVRARLVAVGIAAGGTVSTWEHDGSSWSAAIPTPQLQTPGRLVFHAGRGTVVSCTSAALHEWNGAFWNLLGPGHAIAAASAAYDAARNEIVVTGAFAAGTLLTYTWNGAWTMHQPASSPPVRTPAANGYHSLGYDEVRQRVVLFGGRDPLTGTGTVGHFHFFDDLWEWDGTTWSQRVLPHAPTPREAAALVFDRARQQLLVLSGTRQEFNGATLAFSDVWALDATAPATVTTLGPGCGAGPAPVLAPSAPHPGAPAFTLDLHAALANAPSLFLLALASNSTQLGSGCTLFAPAPDVVLFALANPNGLASMHAAIPLGLQGLSFTAQAAVLDPASPLGLAATPGLRITVGR